MEFGSKKALKFLLKKHSLFPKKRLGQHFLIDKRALKKIIKTANLKAKDICLEIGPGLGVLTQELAKKVKKVIAVEKDSQMVEILKETLKDFSNIEIIQGDILKIEINSLKTKPRSFKVVANLPFYLTAPLIRKFLESPKNQPKEMILLIQKEVAQRICQENNILGISVLFYAKAEIIDYVSKKSFWPQPKVDSAIIKIIPQKLPQYVNPEFTKKFFQILKAGFSQPRKKIINNFVKKLNLGKEEVKKWLEKNKIQSDQRPQTLTLNDWLNLTKDFSDFY